MKSRNRHEILTGETVNIARYKPPDRKYRENLTSSWEDGGGGEYREVLICKREITQSTGNIAGLLTWAAANMAERGKYLTIVMSG